MHKREFHLVARARVGWGKGDYSFFSLFGPANVRKNHWGFPAGRQKRRGLGGIFARLFCAVGAVGWEAFPPSWYQDIKAKQFSIPFKRKRVARKIKELKRKLFCFARRVSAGGNAGAGFQIIRAIFARKRFELRPVIATRCNPLKILPK